MYSGTEQHEDEHRARWPGGEFSRSDPLFLAGYQSKRIAIRSTSALGPIWIEPLLAHNRGPFELLSPQRKENLVKEIPELPLATDVEWQPPETEAIVVDDLDPNFSVVKRAPEVENFSFFETVFHASTDKYEYDRGLRVSNSLRFGI